MPDAVELRGIHKSYDRFVAVDHLSFNIREGGVYGLLGPNGAGKTTTIRMMIGINIPDEGEVWLFGEKFHREQLQRIGYLPEERGLYKRMKVLDHLIFLGRLHGLPEHKSRKRSLAWCERLQLNEWTHKKVEELSKGMQQKVQFIAALLHDPDLVIMDEPFSGLDPINAQALKDAVVELKARGKTVIFSTHVMENAERMCDAVCIIARGEKILDGSVTAVKTTHGTQSIAVSLRDAGPKYAAVFSDTSLVAKVDDQNRFVECELAQGD